MKKFLETKSRVSKAIKNQYILKKSHMTMQDLVKILAFHFQHAKLALSLIMIMERIHKGKILFIAISLSIIFPHFPSNIGVCDWGSLSRTIIDVSRCMVFQKRLKWREIRGSIIE
jgi:hypothetical protein